jgi:hypothetical protein
MLRKPAQARTTNDLVTNCDIHYTRAKSHNNASHINARHKGWVRLELVLALAHQYIGKIDAGGFNLNEHFPRLWCGPLNLCDASPAEVVTQSMANKGAHEA